MAPLLAIIIRPVRKGPHARRWASIKRVVLLFISKSDHGNEPEADDQPVEAEEMPGLPGLAGF